MNTERVFSEGECTLLVPPKPSAWTCHLFGGSSIRWTPPEGEAPNWFWRKMQYLCFGNRWVYTGSDVKDDFQHEDNND